MDNNKFFCVKCGDCCRNFDANRLNDLTIFPKIEDDKIILSKPSLVLYDWEINNFPKHLVTPYLAYFDLKNDNLIIVNYTLNVNSCPHVKDDDNCGIYKNRPIICRVFPCNYDGSKEEIELNSLRSAYGFCRAELPNKELLILLGGRLVDSKNIQLTSVDFKKRLLERYGDGFLYNFQLGIVTQMLNRIIKNLDEEKRIRIVKEKDCIPNLFEQIKKAKRINISDLIKDMLSEDIKEFYSKEWLDKIRMDINKN